MPKERTNPQPEISSSLSDGEKLLIAQLVIAGASNEMTFAEAAAIVTEYAVDEDDPRSVASGNAWRARNNGQE